MSFPTNLDSFVTPDNTKYQDDPLYTETAIIWALNTAVTALENKVWVDNSAVTTSLDYKTSRLTTKGDILTHDWTNPIRQPAWTNWHMLVVDNTSATGLGYIAPTSWGTVTSIAVTPANGLTGSVANPTTTPSITLGTTITGMLKGNWTAVSAGTAWADYLTPLTALPPWSVQDYAWSSAPTGWLLCDWTAVSRATYSALFAITWVSYWAWNGTTTFNLPDARGRVSVGVDWGTFAGLGSTWGEQTHVLTVGEMPQHNHWLATGTSWGTLYSYIPTSGANWTGTWNANTNVDAGNYAHLTLTNGSSTAHNNLQPYLTFNKIIKY